MCSNCDSNKEALRKYLRHERLYQMIRQGSMSKNKTIWGYLEHYAADRSRRIEGLSALVNEEDRLQGPRKADYAAQYLEDYFK